MARLNEPPVSSDSLEALRRKFLRQNRDIARVNSTQSLRIRHLEGEYARLLSENLTLRGQIVALEKAAENNPARRIADHALEIKARMEAQLLQMGSLLESLGLEPPMKRRPPHVEERKIAKPRSSLSQSPPQRRNRDLTAEEREALAAQEGRLPPIHEHKPYPRQTLNREEILALCCEAESSTNSPILGPPPVSRYTEDEPEKVDSPNNTKRLLVYSDITVSEKNHLAAPKIEPPETTPVPSPSKKAAPAPEPKKEARHQTQVIEQPPAQADIVLAKSRSKRKYAITDENEVTSFAKDADVTTGGKADKEKPTSSTVREIKNRRNARNMAAVRRTDAPDTKPGAVASAAARPALAAKSTNEDVSSPRKVSTKGTTATSEKSDAKAAPVGEPRVKETTRPVKQDLARVVPIITAPPSPASVRELRPADVANAAAALLSPGTPGQLPSREASCDTPPPQDISLGGDTARPSRRARAAVSYAEPNLRDKMRRPTKELTDAVSGEGKYKQRVSMSNETATAVPRSAAKEDTSAGAPAHHMGSKSSGHNVREDHSKASLMSPTAAKSPSPVPVASVTVANVTNRRKRMPSMDDRGDGSVSKADAITVQELRPATASNVTKENQRPSQPLDPYEFTSVSPAAQTIATVERSSSMRAAGSRPSRRPISMALDQEAAGMAAAAMIKAASRPVASKKRASLATTSRKTAYAEGSDDEYVAEAETDLNSSRISRRRSMML